MRSQPVLLFMALLGGTACSSPDEALGDAHLVLVSAPQTATPGSRALQPVIVRVTSGDGVGISGVPVAWTIKSGTGRLTASADTSGVDGLASALFTPGLHAGPQEIGAYLYDSPALTITVQADAFRADKIGTQYRSGCGIRGGSTWCWDYRYSTTATITRVMAQVTARDLAMAGNYLCLLDVAGNAHCQRWAQNPNPDEEVGVSGLPPLSAISAGGSGRFCGIAQADSTPWCWGPSNWAGAQVSGTLRLAQIILGYSNSCGLTSAGIAWCWGGGNPVPLAGDFAFRKLGVGVTESCGVVAPTRLFCWENGNAPSYAGIDAADVAMGYIWNLASGSLGTQSFGLTSAVPWYRRESAFPVQAVQISSQDDTPCLVAPDAAVYCLGVIDNIEQFYQTTWEAIPAPQP